MTRRLLAVLCLLAAVPAVSSGQTTPQTPPPPSAAELAQTLIFDPRTITGTLPNGLRYYIRENKYPLKRAELRLAVQVGSVVEDKDQLGLAHFTEHMAFNGTEHFPKHEIVNYLQSIGTRFGPDVNAYTSFDETVYMLTVPTDTGNFLSKGMDILADWAHAQTFDPAEVDAERGVVIEEWRLRRGAGARMQDKQFPVLLRGSQYADRLPIGNADWLRSFPQEAVKRFYKDWYRPDLMAVVLVGDFDGKQVEQMVKDRFGPLKNPANPRPRPSFPVPSHAETYATVATDPEAPNSSVVMYSMLPPRVQTTNQYFRDNIIQGMYFAMLNARLSEIGQKPNAPFAYAGMGKGYFVKSADAFTLSAGVKNGGILAGFEAALTEAERAARHGFTQSELDRQKVSSLRYWDQLLTTKEQQPSATRAAEILRHFLNGEFVTGTEEEGRLQKRYIPGITLAEVNAYARLNPPQNNRVIMANAPAKEGVTVPTEAELLGVYAAVKAKQLDPYKDYVATAPLVAKAPKGSPVVSTKTIEEIGVTEWTLGNGVHVVLKPTDYVTDQVVISATSPGGLSQAAMSDFTSSQFATTAMSTGGLGSFSAVELRKVLTGKTANVSAMIGTRSEGVSGIASRKDIETMMQLVYLNFTAPRRDSSAFLAFKQAMSAQMANRAASPQGAFQDTVSVTMASYNPIARPVTPAMLEEIDLDKAIAFYKDRFSDASDFTFFIVGSFDIDSIKPYVQTYLGGLPATNRKEVGRDLGVKPPTGVIEKTVRKGSEPQSQSYIAFTGPFEYSAVNRYVLQSMGEILQNRLTDKLREKLGGTYSVGASASGARDEPRTYTATIRFGSAPDRADELAKAVMAELELLKTEGPTAADINKVQEAQRRVRELGLKQNSFWSGQLSQAYTYGDDPRDVLKYDELMKSLTIDAVKAAAQKTFRMDNYVRITLLPMNIVQ